MRSKHQREIPADASSDKQEEEYYLPPRTAVHPSENGKWTRIFYRTMLSLFIMLLIGLMIWGIRIR